MHPRSRWVGVLAAFLIGGAGVWMLTRESGTSSEGLRTGQPTAVAEGQPGATELEAPTNRTAEARAEQKSSPRQVAGTVLSDAGPIQGAVVSLTIATDLDRELEPAWQPDDWGPLDRRVLWTESDASGRFVFEASEDMPHGAVIWGTHPGHIGGCVVLDPDRDAWPPEANLMLERAFELHVMVRDAEGRPVPGAKVEQFGLAPAASPRERPGLGVAQARRFLARTASTGTDGLATLGAFPGEQVVVASRSGEISAPWRGQAREHVHLTLAAAFEVSGRVELPDWSHLNYGGERRITIAAGNRNIWRALHTIRAVRDGRWGPLTLPLLDVEQYRIRLEGSPIIPEERFFPPPLPGAQLEHDLIAALGSPVWVQVLGEDNRPLPEAKARVQWQDEDNPDGWNFIERGPFPPGHPREGLIGLWSVPPGSVIIEASAPGHVTSRTGLEPARALEVDYLPIQLTRAARVKGRCLHKGEPVRDFEVLTWRTSDRDYTATPFFDREDGSFELDTAPSGDCWITASSGALPGCEPRQIRTSPAGTTEVVLELPESLRGFGQVVDEKSGAGVPDAKVQLFMPGDILPIARWGDPIPAGADGVFELEGFRAGNNDLGIEAPGYSYRMLTRSAAPGEALDWGVVPLARSHTLTVVLEDASGGKDFRRTSVAVTGNQMVPEREVSAQGVVEFPDLGAGDYVLVINEPNGTTTSLLTHLLPGRDWTLRHRIAGPKRLTVEVVASPEQLVGSLGIAVMWSSPEGYSVMRAVGPVTDAQRVFEIEGIDAEVVQAEIYDAQQVSLASASGQFSGDRLHMPLALDGDPFELVVLDLERQPVADVLVVLSDPERPGFYLTRSTDAGGTCVLNGVPDRRVFVSLRHGTKGSHLGIPVDATSRKAEVILDAHAAIDLLFRDGDVSLGGVTCSLLDRTGFVHLSTQADGEGRLLLEAMGEGQYGIRASRSDCWPAEFTVSARVGGQAETVTLRRLGDLELRVSIEGGLPVSGLPMQLTSIEFGTSVETWIDAGQVRSPGLVTDLTGRVALEGLPHGPYDWAVTLPDGQAREGQLIVEPARDNSIEIVLPP